MPPLITTDLLNTLEVGALRPGQQNVIDSLLAGKNTLALMPTGAGKSLCYQLAALLLGGTSLVISPLLALMKEQVDFLCAKGIAAARWDSTHDESEKDTLKKALLGGETTLIFISPESLQSKDFQEIIPHIPWKLFVIDEIHCYSEWGQSFRPEYRQLPFFAESLSCPTLALTATAPESVVTEISTHFHIDEENIIRLPLRKENISRHIKILTADKKIPTLLEYLSHADNQPTIIYVNTREEAESVATTLQKNKLSAHSYHAGLPTAIREQLHLDYKKNTLHILVATTAFGMGVDKSNVRSVIHYNIPASLENYLQESGRAGRDGKHAQSLVFLDVADLLPLENRIHAQTPSKNNIDSFLRYLLPRATKNIRIYSEWDSMRHYDLSEGQLKRLLIQLELSHTISWMGQGKKNWKAKAKISPERLLAGHSSKEKERLTWIQEHPQFSLEEASEALSLSLVEMQIWLDELALSNDWLISSSHKLKFYCQHKNIPSYSQLAAEFTQNFRQQTENTLQKLTQTWNFFGSTTCYNQQLEHYFGETPQAPCQHCPVCRQEPLELPPLPPCPELTHEDIAFIQELIAMKHPSLKSTRLMARFLTGFLSPAALTARLWKLPHYGAYKKFPLKMLELYCQQIFS